MARGMTPDDLYAIRWVSDARLSPDGATVAFTVTTMDKEKDDYRSAIWTVPAGGAGEPRRLTYGGGKESAPRWSPDGSRLAFLSDRGGGKAQIYVVDAAGGEARALGTIADGAGGPLWSPDGRRIACVARVSTETPKPESGKPVTPPARLITAMKYRANGEGFTYDRRRHIFLLDADGGDVRQITSGDWDDTAPTWSPDGRRIAFVSARHHDRDHDRAEDLWVLDVDAEGAEPVRITPGGFSVALPAWSPDGRSIAFLGYEDAEDAPRNSRLWLVSPEGGAPRLLTGDLDRNLEVSETAGPVWAADSASVYCLMDDRGATRCIAARVVDGTVAQMRSGLSVASFDVHPSSTVVFVGSMPGRPAEVFVHYDDRDEQPLTDLNGAWRAAVDLPHPEHFTVTNDGVEIDAWVMKPAGFREGERYPALVNVHGGPFVQYGYGFLDEFQVQAGAGFAVIFCNPRGSSGREDAFARAIVGCPGEPDSADILAVVDGALARFDFIDPDRLGLLGGSYGGYLTAWIVGRDHRFRAAAPERGLYNRYSKEGTSDIWSGYTYLRVRQYDDPELYWRYSPISRVKEIRTPLLIIHSEEDIRCPIEQGEQLFAALVQLRRDVRFLRFPGENHNLSRSGKPSHRVQRFRAILDWFTENLAPGAVPPAG